jgi:hypothetical protein
MQRRYKASLAGLAVLVLMAGSGCTGDAEGDPGMGGDEELVGTWQLASVATNDAEPVSSAQLGWSMQMRLAEDGTAEVEETRQSVPAAGTGTWSGGTGRFTLDVDLYRWLGRYTIVSNEFTVSGIPNYDGQGTTADLIFTRR